MKPKILTISIAAYNIEKYIAKALDSLISDNIDSLEIFVVDDGGTDNTLKIAQTYADKYPNSIFCIHKNNGGYGSTINTTIELATGKYYKQLDGDDWLCKANLDNFIGLLNYTNADVVLSSSNNFYEEYNQCTSSNYDYVNEGYYDDIEETSLHTKFSIHNVTFLTSMLKKIYHPLTEHCFYTDSEFISYPMPYIKTIYVSHMTTYIYRVGGRDEQSSTMYGIRNHYHDMEYVIKNIVKIYKGLDDQLVCKRSIMRSLIQARINELFRFYCILPISVMSIKRMRRFEMWLKKECPDALSGIIHDSKTLKILLGSHYLAYPLVCIWVRQRWRKLKK